MVALDAALGSRGCPSGLSVPACSAAAPPDPTAFAQSDGPDRHRIELLVKGARCAACIRKIETSLLAMDAVSDARLNLSTGRLSIAWRGEKTRAVGFVARLASLGYEASAFDPAASLQERDEEGRRLLRRLAVAGFAAANIMMLFSVPVWSGHGEMGPATKAFMHWASALIAFPAALFAAQPFFGSAWRALQRGRANMDVPISIAVALTLAMSLYETAIGGGHAYFDGVAMLLFLLLIGRYLDHRLRERARTAARDLLALQAVTATRLDPDGTARAISAREIAPGDRLAIAPGDRIPADGVIEHGVSELDCAILTGESLPVAARPGDQAHAGATNLTRPLVLRATQTSDHSTVAELARLIEMGEQSRARHVRLADKAVALYVPVVHTLAALTFTGWLAIPLALSALGFAAPEPSVRVALTNAVAVLIITCPCALGLAVPAVQVVATGRLFKRGVFVKSGDALERLAQADRVVLDKTGTLTLGRPELATPLDPDILRAAASLARTSRHPLSRALTEAAGPGVAAENVEEIPGRGLEGLVDGARARLGSRAFAAPDSDAGATHEGEELWFSRGDASPVQILFRDALRADAAAAIQAFAERGLRSEILSGDRPEAVAAAAAAAGVCEWRASVPPQGKVQRMRDLRAGGSRPFMIGDGLNDAAALAGAHVSASPGTAIGASQAAADFVLQGAALAPLVEAIDVARAARRRVLENFALAAVYNAIAAPLAAAGLVTPLIAALAMSGSSLIVTLNALRLTQGTNRWKL